MDEASKQYLAETEVIFRETNQDVADFIVEDEGPDTRTTLPFYCECSNTDCRDRIRLTPQTYTKLHKNKRQFIAVTGHEIPEIEKVVRQEDGFFVIEKYGDPPDSQSIERAIKKIKI